MAAKFSLFYSSKDQSMITELLASDIESTKLDCSLLPNKINDLLVLEPDLDRSLYRLDLDNHLLYATLINFMDNIGNPLYKKVYKDKLKSFSPHVDPVFFEIDGIKIMKADLIQLGPGKNTSDSVINAFAKMLSLKQLEKSVKIFPTELFTSMYISNGEKYCYENVSGWNKTNCILQNEILLFPIFVQSGHWAVVVVFMKDREMYYLDSKNYNGGDKILKCILRFLYDESLKHCVPMKNLDSWKLYYKGIGEKQQGPNLNCGMFALVYIDMITNGFPIKLVDDGFVNSYRFYVSSCFIQGKMTKSELELDIARLNKIVDHEIDMKVPLVEVKVETVDLTVESGSLLLDSMKPVQIDFPDDITNHLKSKGVDPFEYAEKVMGGLELYVAKHYNSKTVFNSGEGLCFYLSTSQILTKSGIRNRSEVSLVSLKSSLKLGMVQNEAIVRGMLSESRCIPEDKNTKTKFKNWVNKAVDGWTQEYIICIASYLWNIRFEIVCEKAIMIYDPDIVKPYPTLPIPTNLLKETVRIVYNMVDHYKAIEELSNTTADTKIKEMVASMDIHAKLSVEM